MPEMGCVVSRFMLDICPPCYWPCPLYRRWRLHLDAIHHCTVLFLFLPIQEEAPWMLYLASGTQVGSGVSIWSSCNFGGWELET